LPASYRESILYMGPLKVFKTGSLRMIVTLMQSILCRQNTHTKYFTGGGGGSRRSLRSPATAAVDFDRSAAGHTNSENASVSAVAGEVGAVAFPLGDVCSRLAYQSEVGVEFTGDHALVLSVEIAQHVASFRQRQRVNRLAIVELHADLCQQLRERIDRSPDSKALGAAPQQSKAALDYIPVSQLVHQRRIPSPRSEVVAG